MACRVLRTGLNRLAELLLLRKGNAEIRDRRERGEQDRRRQGEFDRRYASVGPEKAPKAGGKASPHARSVRFRARTSPLSTGNPPT